MGVFSVQMSENSVGLLAFVVGLFSNAKAGTRHPTPEIAPGVVSTYCQYAHPTPNERQYSSLQNNRGRVYAPPKILEVVQ
jgi:hypothetical protein